MISPSAFLLLMIAFFLMAFTVALYLFLSTYRRKLAEERLDAARKESDMNQRLLRSEVEAKEEERVYIAAELHDEVSSRLTLLKFLLRSHRNEIPSTLLDSIDTEIDATASHISRLSNELAPAGLDIADFKTFLESWVVQIRNQHQSVVAITIDGILPEYPVRTKAMIFRICQEFVTNSLRHAGQTPIFIDVHTTPEGVRFQFSDEGKGFDMHSATQGYGIRSMLSRLAYICAPYTFQSTPGKGTVLEFTVPMA